MQRKNKAVISSSGLSNDALEVSAPSPSKPASSTSSSSAVVVASVHRPACGTSPFARRWLNLDCCGLICASLTYALHAFGAYVFGWILVPTCWTMVDDDGNRQLSFGGLLHRTLFLLIASLAVLAHFKAMTTDPGAVPPDATPLPDLDELDTFVKGEQQQHQYLHTPNHSTHTVSMHDDASLLLPLHNDDNSSNTLHNHSDHSTNSQELHTGHHFHDTPNSVSTLAMGAAAAVAVAASAIAPSPSDIATEKHLDVQDTRINPMISSTLRGQRMCRRCHAFKPPRAHHCSICKRCIIKMDHHCPWVNNCVGIGNHKYFLLFIFYTSLSCIYSFTFLVYRFVHCVGHPTRIYRCVDHAADLLPLIGLTAEALLFGLFTICMIVDQFDVVMTNVTHIDRLKGIGGYHTHTNYNNNSHGHSSYTAHHLHGTNGRNWSAGGVHEVFGAGRRGVTQSNSSHDRAGMFHYTWLSPFHNVCFPDPIRDDIFGYCRPCLRFTSSNRLFQRDTAAIRGQRSMEMVDRGEMAQMVEVTDIV